MRALLLILVLLATPLGAEPRCRWPTPDGGCRTVLDKSKPIPPIVDRHSSLHVCIGLCDGGGGPTRDPTLGETSPVPRFPLGTVPLRFPLSPKVAPEEKLPLAVAEDNGPGLPHAAQRRGVELLLNGWLYTAFDTGDFGLMRNDGRNHVDMLETTLPLTGLAPDPADPDCLLVSAAGHGSFIQEGGVYRLCPLQSWELVRLPEISDPRNEDALGQTPVLALSGDGRRVWALTEGKLWTLTQGAWTSALLHMGQVPAGREVVFPGFRLTRDAAGRVSARPSPLGENPPGGVQSGAAAPKSRP